MCILIHSVVLSAILSVDPRDIRGDIRGVIHGITGRSAESAIKSIAVSFAKWLIHWAGD
ncbi:MAG: hypothetical protein KGZ86_03255 [Candidatus Latescibacteria bacterium]|nr:hypothetical protein [Candidatus Latescibacterota bacterium]